MEQTAPVSTPQPNGIDLNTKIHLVLTVEQVNKILAALGDRPFKEVSDVITAVKGQGDRMLDTLRQRAAMPPSPPPQMQQADGMAENLPSTELQTAGNKRNGARKH